MATPSDSQALQFVIMLQAGLPAEEAIGYFTESADPKERLALLASWRSSRAVRRAQLTLMGKSWQDMALDERIRYALDQHYSALAYLLFSTNYIEAAAPEKAKIDTARTALEMKLAGMAGKGDALSRFFDDLQAGRITLQSAPIPMQKGN